MIKKVRFKFIALSMIALFILLFAIVTSINIINYNEVVSDANQRLLLLATNQGDFPDDRKNNLPHNMSPETPYQIRYFSVLLSSSGQVIQTNTSHIKAIDAYQAVDYTKKVISKNQTKGFVDHFRFISYLENDNIRMTFLDCDRELTAFHSFLITSIGMALTGYFIFFFVILFFSGKIIAPIMESYEKQKRFITDAGHEIKTPLAIINADASVLEMDIGENEWVTDIQKQVKRLSTLTNDLVYLSRMEEENKQLQMIEFPISDVILETASSFQTLAKTQNKVFEVAVESTLSYIGDEKSLQQLINILLDNALKYSPEQGKISLSLKKENKSLILSVYNTTFESLSKENLDHLFERFYRVDHSRNTKTGGYGIGLSIAKAIVINHHGKIQAKTKDGQSLWVIVSLPIG